MGDVLINAPKLPQDWAYDDDYLVAIALSRKIGTLWGRIELEPEVGLRSGSTSSTNRDLGRGLFVMVIFRGTTA